MRLNFYTAIFLLSFPFAGLAQNTDDLNTDLPQPVSGIHIVPDSELTATKSMKEEELSKLKEFKQKGYSESNSPNPKHLLGMKYTSENEIKENKNNTNPYDTHLKAKISDIKLGFKYKGIGFIDPSHVLGFAAIGGYDDKGWTGIKEFFNDSKLGTCALSLYNIALSHGGARLGKSSVTYDINNKPTTIAVEGNINSGFMYRVSWFDNTFIHDLECANMGFKKYITSTMINYSRLIDQSLV